MASKPEIADEFFGKVPPGWKRDHYIDELRRLVEVCKTNRPDRAEYWSRWLDELLQSEPY